jgi:hypothetical protein
MEHGLKNQSDQRTPPQFLFVERCLDGDLFASGRIRSPSTGGLQCVGQEHVGEFRGDHGTWNTALVDVLHACFSRRDVGQEIHRSLLARVDIHHR